MNGRSDDVALADGRALIMEEANLNAVQRRCLAVLRGGRASEELKAAATTMLRTGEPSKKARMAGGIGMPRGTATRGGAPAAAAAAAPAALAAAPAAAGWACAACTMQNAMSAKKCTMCGEAKAKPSRPRTLPTDLDDEERDAFAAPKKKKGKEPVPQPAAVRPTGADEDSDEWE